MSDQAAPKGPVIQPPDGWGENCLPWLAANGITPRKAVPIRSSLLDLALTDPFLLYLKEILGLSSPFAYSKALCRGSWAHKRMEALLLEPPAVKTFMNNAFALRKAELLEAATTFGVLAEDGTIDSIIAREERSFKCAWGWHEAAMDLPIPADNIPGGTTVKRFLTKGTLKLLASELLVSLKVPEFPNNPFVIQIDQLYHDTASNQLWILDYKTCEENPRVRLSTCNIEFQTQHYLYTFTTMLERNRAALQKVIPDLPSNATLAGMMHLAHQKPTIDFGTNDRAFKWVSRVLKSGPRKGLEVMEKVYDEGAEPDFDLYIQRCGRWYKGEGEYLAVATDRQQSPPINISFTPLSHALDTDGFSQYHARLQYIDSLLSRPPLPCNFIRNPKTTREHGKVHPLAPFYICPPIQWPDIIGTNRLIQKFRDDHIDGQPEGVHECQNPTPQ